MLFVCFFFLRQNKDSPGSLLTVTLCLYLFLRQTIAMHGELLFFSLQNSPRVKGVPEVPSAASPAPSVTSMVCAVSMVAVETLKIWLINSVVRATSLNDTTSAAAGSPVKAVSCSEGYTALSSCTKCGQSRHVVPLSLSPSPPPPPPLPPPPV